MTEPEPGTDAPILTARASSVGAIREPLDGERRVAVTPPSASLLAKAGFSVLVESGAGSDAGYADSAYADAGASLVDRAGALAADVLLRVRATAWPEGGEPRQTAVVVGLGDPLGHPEDVARLAGRGVSFFALELLPRVTRGQPMDVLSSQATVAGYKAVLLAAEALPKMFPLLTTAAGTVTPARVFLVGAGVAGLQAIATARRLGGVVEAYDVRPAVREEVSSLGARFLEISLDTGGDGSSGSGAYAQELQEETLRRQRELMTAAVAGADVVITTAQVPGRKAPVLVTAEMVDGMAPGSVVVDLACEQGGNCEVTRNGEVVVTPRGVRVIGPANITSTVAWHASQLYARNLANFLQYVVADGSLTVAADDEIATGTLVCHGGQVVHPRVLDALQSEKAPA
ncbi:MAG TPA: NAD(P) transhydrogenase subunit alpha [Actinomycetota bacterium]|nr:NAD(P) transhydrogenase subunit alpha [Actinomycetota bacterium]